MNDYVITPEEYNRRQIAERYEYQCVKCGAITKGSAKSEEHDKWHRMVEKGIQMAKVLWCDLGPNGGHAFKAGEPGSQNMTVTQTDENGKPTLVEMDVCAEHAFGGPQRSPLREVEAAYEAERGAHHNHD